MLNAKAARLCNSVRWRMDREVTTTSDTCGRHAHHVGVVQEIEVVRWQNTRKLQPTTRGVAFELGLVVQVCIAEGKMHRINNQSSPGASRDTSTWPTRASKAISRLLDKSMAMAATRQTQTRARG